MVPKTWCSSTKEQGFAGSEAPRPARRQRLWSQRRGACRRKSKGFRGVKHHVRLAGSVFGPKDVVPVDERARFCGNACTKSAPAGLRKGTRTWCKGNEGTRLCGDSCTKSAPAERRKGSRTWCKGNGGTRLCGDSCTKSEPADRRKGTRTWCKGNGGTGFCGESCTKSAPAGRRRAKPSAARPSVAQSPAPAAPKNNKKRESTRSLRVRSAFVGSSRQSIFPRF